MLLFLSYSVMPEYFWSHGLQHTRLHYLLDFSQTHVHWVDDAIQPSHLLSPPSPPAFNLFQHPGLFQWISQLFSSGGQILGASASASDLPLNIQGWFPFGLTGLISFQSRGLSIVFSSTTFEKHQIFGAQSSFMVWLSHLYVTTGKNIHSFIYHILNVSRVLKPLQIWETEEQRNPCLSSTQMWKEIHTNTETSHN